MRLVSYRSEGGICAGVQTVNGILDAGGLLGERPIGLRRLIEEGRLGKLAERVEPAGDRDGPAARLSGTSARRRP